MSYKNSITINMGAIHRTDFRKVFYKKDEAIRWKNMILRERCRDCGGQAVNDPISQNFHDSYYRGKPGHIETRYCCPCVGWRFDMDRVKEQWEILKELI